MGFSFEKLNKDFNNNYMGLKELYELNGEERVYVIKGCWINTKSEYVKEAPVIIINGTNVNVPKHQLDTIKAILASPDAMASIARGEAGFSIESYKTTDTFYKVHFVDIEPGTIDENYILADFDNE